MDRTLLPSIALLAAVAKTMSFRAAARDLGLSPSALSHAVTTLENRLDVQLLHRTTRQVTLTEAGRRLLSRVEPALREIGDAIDDAHAAQGRPAGPLRLTVPRLAAETVLLPAVPAFHRLYPDVTLDLVINDNRVDILAENFDAGIRLGELLHQDMIAVPLGGELRSAVVAAPAYLADHPAPQTPDDLAAHRCIGRRYSAEAPYRWEFTRYGRDVRVTTPAVLILNDNGLVVEAALAGVGLAYCVESRVLPHLASGALIRVLDDWCPRYPGFFLYYPSRNHQRPALRAFVDFIRDHVGRGAAPS